MTTTTTTTTKAERIQKQIADTERLRSEAARDREKAIEELSNTPGDKALMSKLDAIEKELGEYDRQVARLQDALAAATAQRSEEETAAEAARQAEAHKRVINLSVQRVNAAKAVDKAIATLGDALAAYAATGEALAQEALPLYKVAHRQGTGREARLDDVWDVRELMTSYTAVRGALPQRLVEIGLGRVGIQCPETLIVTPTSSTLSIERASELAHHKLQAILERVLNAQPVKGE